MTYRVILTKNGKYKKTLHRCRTKDTSFNNFHKIIRENNVFFERKFINYKGIKPVEYKILVVKDLEEGDSKRIVRNHLGKLVEEEPIGGIWTILADAEYLVEETFWVFGFNPLTERKNIKDVIQILLVGMYNPEKTRQIVVVNNKLIFYDEDRFDMIICKCKKDAQRLHHALFDAAKQNKIKGLYFMGTANENMMGEYYDIIHDHTGWSYTKIWRTTTRP